jgi:hypothetical protein
LTEKNSPTEEDLLAVLLEKNVLSPAQLEVVKIDIAATGLSPIDVLLARKWITERDLSEYGPLLQGGGSGSTGTSTGSTGSGGLSAGSTGAGRSTGQSAKESGGLPTGNGETSSGSSRNTDGSSVNAPGSSEQIYLDNLRKYRQLLAQIMGDTD